MKKGVINNYNNRKGFGYIISDTNGEKIFFHKSNVNSSFVLTQKVSFEESKNSFGKIAININVIKEDIIKETKLITPAKKNSRLENLDSKQIIKSIADNWKLEAKLETQKNYFYHLEEVNQILNKSKYYIIGRKGSGKSSISEYILGLSGFDTFCEKLSFKNFPFNELYGLDNQKYTSPNQYITLWKYLIYSTVAKLMAVNQNIDSSVRSKLLEIYKPDPIKSLSRTINNWTSAEFGATILGTGGNFKIGKDIQVQSNNWIERVNALEDIILNYCDKSTYFIIFDELDEDYRSIKSEEHPQYNYLLTSLFKAVQDIKYTFSSTHINLCPLVFLRDDIYTLIKDSDKNKWRDFKIEIEWTSAKIKKLIAYRISKDANKDKDFSFQNAWELIFSNNEIKAGNKQTVVVNVFDYITRSTHLRPRDFIRYFQVCCEETINRNGHKISNDTVKFVDRAFSNYLRDEIVDELTPLLPDIEEIFQIISNLRKQSFSIDEFKNEYKKYLTSKTVTEENIDYVLDVLFRFSVLGNQNKKKADVLYFKYMQTNMNLNRDEHLIVHRGLFKALQII